MSNGGSEESIPKPERILLSLDSVVNTDFDSIRVDIDETSDESDKGESIRLETAVDPGYKFSTLRVQTEVFIKKFRTRVAGVLALSLWISLLFSSWWHTHMIGIISVSALENGSSTEGNENKTDFEAHDKASAIVGDTAKTLYAVISPLATAITGFYFVIQTNKSDEDED